MDRVTAGELRAALTGVPDDYRVLICVDDTSADWAHGIEIDHGARTVDLHGELTS